MPDTEAKQIPPGFTGTAYAVDDDWGRGCKVAEHFVTRTTEKSWWDSDERRHDKTGKFGSCLYPRLFTTPLDALRDFQRHAIKTLAMQEKRTADAKLVLLLVEDAIRKEPTNA